MFKFIDSFVLLSPTVTVSWLQESVISIADFTMSVFSIFQMSMELTHLASLCALVPLLLCCASKHTATAAQQNKVNGPRTAESPPDYFKETEAENSPQVSLKHSTDNKYISQRSPPNSRQHGKFSEDSKFDNNVSNSVLKSKNVKLEYLGNITLYDMLTSRLMLNSISSPNAPFSSQSVANLVDIGVSKRDPKIAENLSEVGTRAKRPNSWPEYEPSGGSTSPCELDQVDIAVQFTETVTVNNRDSLLKCTGVVTVNKCEGLCTSTVTPTFSGFLSVWDNYITTCPVKLF